MTNTINYIDYKDLQAIERIAKRLRKWCIMECNYSIYRENGICYIEFEDGYKKRIFDSETKALKQLQQIVDKYKDLKYYYQTDPRGKTIYLYLEPDLIKRGERIEACYNSISFECF